MKRQSNLSKKRNASGGARMKRRRKSKPRWIKYIKEVGETVKPTNKHRDDWAWTALILIILAIVLGNLLGHV